MQRTVYVEHKGNHQADDAGIRKALDAELHAEGEKRVGGYKVLGYENESNVGTKFTLTFDVETKADPKAEKKS